MRTIDQQIRQAQIRVHQAEAGGPHAKAFDAPSYELQRLLQYSNARLVQADAGTPWTPIAVRADHCIHIPALALESGWQVPRLRMPVHPGRKFAQARKPLHRVFAGIGLPSRQPLESHRVARRPAGRRLQRVHQLAVTAGYRGRRFHHVVATQRIDPCQFRTDLIGRRIADPMHAQHQITPAARIAEREGGVFRKIQQADHGL